MLSNLVKLRERRTDLERCKRKLGDFVKLTQGINQTRFKRTKNIEDIKLYDQSLFEEDLLIDTEPNQKLFDGTIKTDAVLLTGDVVINMMKQMATIVSDDNSGKVLSMNFIRVDFKKNELDKRYFVYLFNANKMVAKQKERETQGTAAVLKIPIRSIEQLEIPYLSLDEQKKIGQSYMKMMSLKKKYQKIVEANEALTLGILEQKTNI